MDAFTALGLDPRLAAALAELGYTEPTPIQRQAIPPLLEGRDVLGQAATGTGKTAAFALPMLQRLAARPGEGAGRPRGLVLVPTRELAIQVCESAARYGQQTAVRAVPIYGGQAIERQLRRLQRGVDLIVATPGRAVDLLGRGLLELSAIEIVILDEADEMLDMGFAEDLETLLAATPEKRQTALFSATLAPRIGALAARHMREPLRIRAQAQQSGSVAQVRQIAYLVERVHKLPSLIRVLDMERPSSALVFCRTRLDVDALCEALNTRGYQAEALHGGLSQEQRDGVMRRFRAGGTSLLVSTNVAARGLDVPHLSHVINYELPADADDYLHRIGRTARAGRAGVAIALVEPSEQGRLRRLEASAQAQIERAQVPSVAALRAQQRERTQGAVRELLAQGDAEVLRPVLQALCAEFDVEQVALAALRLAHAASGGEREEAEIPAPRLESAGRKFPARAPQYGQRAGAPRSGAARPGGAALRVGAGRQQGIRPADLVGALVNEAGLDPREIGGIAIAEHHSTVELAQERLVLLAHTLKRVALRGKRVLVRIESGRRGPAAPQVRAAAQQPRSRPQSGASRRGGA
jgi:ATP-dependent RNA helicase DeaD